MKRLSKDKVMQLMNELPVCFQCEQPIHNHENYIRFRIAGCREWQLFHYRNQNDCWHQFVRENPTIRIMEITNDGLVDFKTFWEM